ncbi:hypothetical protein BX616_003817 [Lobosporangium transversale]|nr:hypothetical protein BX616_003817 [Lobosporangium transversale]
MPDPVAFTARPIIEQMSKTTSGLPAPSMSVHRHSTCQPPLLPLKESPMVPKLNPLPKLDLSLSGFPGKTRKRHKVATSCNRCRQNKRKCDSGIPCSNCKRNKADCLYTDAQQSRSTWGDSPLSKEKIIGVSTADLDPDSPPSTPAAESAGKSSPPPMESTKPSKSSPSTRKPAARKNSTLDSTTPIPSTSFSQSGSPLPRASLFNPGQEEKDSLDRRKKIIEIQSRQIAKTIRITNPGPQFDLSELMPNRVSSAGITNDAHKPFTHGHSGSSTDSLFSNANSPDVTASSATYPLHFQPTSNSAWQYESRMKQLPSSAMVSHRIPGTGFQIQQGAQTSLDTEIIVTSSPSSFSRLTPTFCNNSKRYQLPVSEAPNENQIPLTLSSQPGNLATPAPQDLSISYPIVETSDLRSLSSVSPWFSADNPNIRDFTQETQTPAIQSQRIISEDLNSAVRDGGLTKQQSIYIQQHHPPRHIFSPIHEAQQQTSATTWNPNASLSTYPQKQHSQLPLTDVAQNIGLNDAVASAAPVSFGVSSNLTPSTSMNIPSACQKKGQKSSSNTCLPSMRLDQQSLQQISQLEVLHQGIATVDTDSIRMRKIAKDMLDCRRYDYSILLPRHISQDYDELWAAPQPVKSNSLDGIPRQLLMIPKDANFLVDALTFHRQHAYFYYPIVNRAMVEMELMAPETPQALFLLNIVFMAACKHLARQTDIKRAIQFRERAREIQHYIDERARITRLFAHLLGAQVIYGVFVVTIGFAQLCGTHQPLPLIADSDANERESIIDLATEDQSLMMDKGLIPEAAYQQRLWAFWGYYTRDSMSRLYFGWPHGIDNLAVASELPKIKGFVGLGGTRILKGQNSLSGKRRGSALRKGQAHREKKHIKAETVAPQSDRDIYHAIPSTSDEDYDNDDNDDNDDDDRIGEGGDESEFDQDELLAGSTTIGNRRGISESVGKNRWSKHQERIGKPQDMVANSKSATSSLSGSSHTQERKTLTFGLSRYLLERQSRGEDISHPVEDSKISSGVHSAEVKRHLERMKILLDAENDITDGGSYARILFLEEIKLWMIGRRVGLYLQKRNTSLSVSSVATTTMGISSPYDKQSSVSEASDLFLSPFSATIEASRCSERAWLEDKELQGLQADLIAWEQALPPIFKFRSNADEPDINHKINGRLGNARLMSISLLPVIKSLSTQSKANLIL